MNRFAWIRDRLRRIIVKRSEETMAQKERICRSTGNRDTKRPQICPCGGTLSRYLKDGTEICIRCKKPIPDQS